MRYSRDIRANPSSCLPLLTTLAGSSSILSKGLYTNPLDCLREYVQNSVDAGAERIAIKVQGNAVFINDTGAGMGFEEMLQARKV
jgi:DNA mismatch repair ATPase MutL